MSVMRSVISESIAEWSTHGFKLSPTPTRSPTNLRYQERWRNLSAAGNLRPRLLRRALVARAHQTRGLNDLLRPFRAGRLSRRQGGKRRVLFISHMKRTQAGGWARAGPPSTVTLGQGHGGSRERPDPEPQRRRRTGRVQRAALCRGRSYLRIQCAPVSAP